MEYNIIVSPRAQKEIENALDFIAYTAHALLKISLLL